MPCIAHTSYLEGYTFLQIHLYEIVDSIKLLHSYVVAVQSYNAPSTCTANIVQTGIQTLSIYI